MKYDNPILPGFYPDPSICRVDNDYYLVSSSFEFFPGVPLFHSTDLVNWEQIGHCLTRKKQLPLKEVDFSGGIYAPTLRNHNGRFYMITTNVSARGHFYVWTDDIRGEWSDPVWIDSYGIDPDLFWDDNGSVYLSHTGKDQSIVQCRLDLKTGRPLSEPISTWKGSGGKNPEAPHVYKIDGFYYLMIAEGGTEFGHCISIARGPSPMGPWEACPNNPILTHRSLESPLQATGHGDLIQDTEGNWWGVCLGIRPQGYPAFHVLGRETFLSPIHWSLGWPEWGTRGQIALKMEGPGEDIVQNFPFEFVLDSLTTELLPLHYSFLGNPDNSLWNIGSKGLELQCGKNDLNSKTGIAWIGRRQQHHNFRMTVDMDFYPENENEEAGLSVFQNRKHHYEIIVVKRDEVRCITVRRRIGSLSVESPKQTLPSGKITLVIKGNKETYRLGYLNKDLKFICLEQGEARYLSTEVGGRFTGVFLALFACAHGRLSRNKSRFTNCEYKELTGQ